MLCGSETMLVLDDVWLMLLDGCVVFPCNTERLVKKYKDQINKCMEIRAETSDMRIWQNIIEIDREDIYDRKNGDGML